MEVREVVRELRASADPAAVKGMKRFGISETNTLGVSVLSLRNLAKRIGKNHSLALELWGSGIHEARLLASLVDDPESVTSSQMDSWVKQFDSWDICDGCCGNLFDKTPFAYAKAIEWSRAEPEFVRRAGFSLMAELAVHDKSAPDERFEKFFVLIKNGSIDERNFVKKAVDWALRQIGKRNHRLNRRAIAVARELRHSESKSAKWIAADALRELTSPAVALRLRKVR